MMDSAYIGSIMLWTNNRIPDGWKVCDGTILQVAQNQALFAVIGAKYGGDGRTTFALPDLRGRTAVGTDVLQGRADYALGKAAGTETVSINAAQMPAHTHALMGNKNASAQLASGPLNNVLGIPAKTSSGTNINLYSTSTNNTTSLASNAIMQNGSGAGHQNMQQFIVLQYIICMQGLFPPRQ